MFKTFPEFSKLTLADREEYESYIKDFPPIQDLSFAMLMTWWNALNDLSVAKLNGNLVILYWRLGDESASGLSLVGTNAIDESVCTILDYLRERGEVVRLVHVPEFVVSSLRYPEQFIFENEDSFNECIVKTSNFYPLSNLPSYTESKIVRTLTRVGSRNIELRVLDLRSFLNRQLLLELDRSWRRKGTLSDALVDRVEALRIAVTHATSLGMENVCLFIEGEPQSFLLYRLEKDNTYVLCHLFNFNPDIPDLIDLMIYEFAKWFAKLGVRYANVDSDLGIPLLGSFRLKLGPTNFFRKYTVKPV